MAQQPGTPSNKIAGFCQKHWLDLVLWALVVGLVIFRSVSKAWDFPSALVIALLLFVCLRKPLIRAGKS